MSDILDEAVKAATHEYKLAEAAYQRSKARRQEAIETLIATLGMEHLPPGTYTKHDVKVSFPKTMKLDSSITSLDMAPPGLLRQKLEFNSAAFNGMKHLPEAVKFVQDHVTEVRGAPKIILL